MQCRVVDQDVDPSEPIERLLHRAIDVVFVGDVAANPQRVEATVLERGCCVESRDLVDIDEVDVCALICEGTRECAPEAPASSGDDGDLPPNRIAPLPLMTPDDHSEPPRVPARISGRRIAEAEVV